MIWIYTCGMEKFKVPDHWNREIEEWLNKMGTPERFISHRAGACASYYWWKEAIKKAVERWPAAKNDLKRLEK